MQISPEQGAFLAFLLRLMGATKVVEVGTFTGYSALTMAAALGDGGRLVACDTSVEWTRLGEQAWAEAGLADRIELHIGPGVDTLAALQDDPDAGSWDFGFIDADKVNSIAYYEALLRLLRPGGVVALDNALWSGAVADPEDHSENTSALRAAVLHICSDPRVVHTMLPIGDGLLLALKR
jgi:predicted O-methyltransferase YrrM